MAAINFTITTAQVNAYFRKFFGKSPVGATTDDLRPVADDIQTLSQLTLQRNAAGALLVRNVDNTAAADFIAANVTATSYTGNVIGNVTGDVTGNITGVTEAIKATTASLAVGYMTRGFVTAAKTFSGGATENIAVQVPSGAKILGCQLIVDAIIVSAGGATWAAAYNTGATQSITTGQAKIAGTSVSTFFDVNAATSITNAATDITITPSGGVLTSGKISAVVYYEYFTALAQPV